MLMADITHPLARQVSMTTPTTKQPDLKDALTLHEAGKLAEARAAYGRILENFPNRTDAAHGLALAALDMGQPGEAIPLLFRCIALGPNNPAFRLSLGIALLQGGNAQDAVPQLLEAANTAPQMIEPRLYLARALGALEKWAQAVDVLTTAAETFSNHPEVWTAKGNAERILLRHKKAEGSFRRVLDLKANDPDALNNLAVVVRAQHRFDEAVEIYQSALALAPDHPKVHGNLGNVLVEMGRSAEAEHHLRRAVDLNASNPSSRCNLAIYLTREERAEEAISYFEDVISSAPNFVDAWTNLGVARLALGYTAAAEKCYRRAIELSPENAEAHYNLAWALLLTGQWAEGWQEFEWRWKLDHFSSHQRTFKQPVWDGAALPGGTLLLHAEQGLGDAIQFARYVALAKQRCTHVIVECHPPLAPLFQSLVGADTVIVAGDLLPPFDAHAPFMSLTRIFGTTTDSIPGQSAYISPPSDIPARLRLPDNYRRRIGLVWAGSPDNKIDRRRTIPAEMFATLVSTVDADFVSMQVGPRADEIADLPASKLIFACDREVHDFADTAAVIAQLDLVLGVDTAVLHLAGSMGKPAWMLIPFMPDYRWLLGREDTPWYPSLRLFRQSMPADWAEPLDRVMSALTS